MREEHHAAKSGRGLGAFDRLLIHLDKVVATACIAVVVLQMTGLVFRPAERFRDAQAKAGEAAGILKDALGTTLFPTDERMASVRTAVGRLATELKAPEAVGVDLASGLTYPVAYLKTLRPGESNEIRFVPPSDARAVAEVGGILVTWGEPAGNNVAIGSYEIMRAEDGGQEAAAATVEGGKHEWRDVKIQPGHTYRYRVVAIAGDADLAKTSRGRTAPSPAAEAKAVADFKIELVDLKGGEAVLKVSRWQGGAWRDRPFQVKEGAVVGARDDALGIDFSTGRTVAKIQSETKEVEHTRPEVVFDAKGRVIVEGGAPRRVSVSAKEPVQTIAITLTGGGLPDEVLTLEKR